MNAELASHTAERQRLLSRLLDAVKQCQVRFGGKGELATENDSRVSVLCASWETILQHGLKNTNKALSALKQVTEFTRLSRLKTGMFADLNGMETEPVFWHYVREHLSKTEVERFVLLKKITSDSGRGRAWLRSTLNEHSLERSMHTCLENSKLQSQYYEEWAFLRDHERSSMLPSMAAGLGSIVFAITIDSADLSKPIGSLPAVAGRQLQAGSSGSLPSFSSLLSMQRSEPKPVIILDSSAGGHEQKARKIPAKLVSFDSEGNGGVEYNNSSSYAAREPRNPQSDSASLLSAGSGTSDNSADDGENGGDFTPLDDSGVPVVFKTEEDNQSVDSDFPNYSSSWTDDAMNAVSMATSASSSSLQSERNKALSVTSGTVDTAETMSAAELKQAVITMMMKKDEVEEQNKVLRSMLDQEVEMTGGLRIEINELKRTHEDTQKRDQQRIVSLTKECELLKHQLKKYVNAVQTLRRDGASIDNLLNLGIHLDEPQPPLPVSRAAGEDYSLEAAEYRRKLVQVAEMHGELMEFNEYLQKQVIVRDARIFRLHETLVELRGPLPHDVQLDSAQSEDDSVNWRPLVNLWIPSAFMKGNAKSMYHVYQVYVRIRDQEWNVYRRYSEFYDFHMKLKKKYPLLNTFDFPPKKSVGNKDNKFVEERRKKLQDYVRKAVLHVVERLEEEMEHSTTVRQDMTKLKLISLLPFFNDVAKAESAAKNRRRSKVTVAAVSAATTRTPSLGSTPDRYSGL